MKPIKRTFGYSRKLSDGNYGSAEFSEGFEVELQDGDTQDDFDLLRSECVDRVNEQVEAAIKGKNLLEETE